MTEQGSGPRVTFHPKLLDTLRDYTRRDFSSDLVAGLTVGIVALPLAMAFAIASGAKPEAGIFTAVIAGFLISALGGSKVAIGGPTGAFIVILYGINATYGPANLVICTVMAGCILLIMGFARLGTMIKYIPFPVTMGFTSGIAVLIFATQIKDFFGLQVEQIPSEFVEKLKVLAEHAATFQWPTLVLAAASLARSPAGARARNGRGAGVGDGDRAGFLDRLGRENVCADISIALGRAREILGLPPEESRDPLEEEKHQIEAARRELTGALERTNAMLRKPSGAPPEVPGKNAED